VDGDLVARPIDKQLLAGAMLLAHHYVPLAFPLLVVVAELTVAVAVGMRRCVLFPQQLQGDVLVFLKLFVDVRKVRKVACRGTRWLRIGGEQGEFQLRFGHLLRKRPRQTRRREPTQIFVYRTLAQIRTAGDLALF
jgi:hypothetical protein